MERELPIRATIVAATVALGSLGLVEPPELRAQTPGLAETAPPRGQVLARCYGRMEIWRGGVHAPYRLLYTTVSYNETSGGGVLQSLTQEWSRFVLRKIAEQGRQLDQQDIVYCRYADAPGDTDLASWPATAEAPQAVEWPGYSVPGQVLPLRQAGQDAQPPPTYPQALPPAPQSTTPGTTTLAAQSAPTLPLGPTSAAAVVPAAVDAAPAQEVDATYAETMRRDERIRREQEARESAYRGQLEEYQRQMAASQNAQRQFEEKQKAYEAEKAAYDAKFGK